MSYKMFSPYIGHAYHLIVVLAASAAVSGCAPPSELGLDSGVAPEGLEPGTEGGPCLTSYYFCFLGQCQAVQYCQYPFACDFGTCIMDMSVYDVILCDGGTTAITGGCVSDLDASLVDGEPDYNVQVDAAM